MSFWPFNAQNNINSTTNLNRLLDIYYQHRKIIPAAVSAQNDTQAKISDENDDDNNNNNNNNTDNALSPLSNNIYNSSSSKGGDQSMEDDLIERNYPEEDRIDKEDEVVEEEELQRKKAGLPLSQEKQTKKIQIQEEERNEDEEEEDEFLEAIADQPPVEGLEQSEEPEYSDKIDREFIHEILDDVSLLGELNNQNNRVLDFLCFGYINESSSTDNTVIAATTTTVAKDGEDKKSIDYKLDEDGDVITIHDDEELQAVKSQGSTFTSVFKTKKTQDNVVSILEVLVDIIVDSIDWFEQNESFLFQNHQNSGEQDLTEELSVTFNRIHVASEILSSKIWLVSESLVEEPTLLTKLWWFLKYDNSKDSSPALQYFIKINEQLLESRPDQMLNFIRLQTSLVDDFIKHVDITIIMDFLLRIITTDKMDIPTGIIDLLSEQKLIPKLLNLLLRPDVDSSTQSSTGDFLKALISISANTSIDENTIGPNLLTKELVSEQSVLQMVRIIENRGNGLSTIVGVIIEIIRKNNSDYDSVNLLYTSLESHPPSKRDPIYLGPFLKLFSESLPQFNDILIDEQLCQKRYTNQLQEEFQPLGFERFKVCELIAELLHCSNIALLNNDLTEGILQEREKVLCSQEDNLANALNEALEDEPSHSSSSAGGAHVLNIPGKLSHVIGTAEPSVALNADNVTISPNQTPSQTSNDGLLPLHELTEEAEQKRKEQEEEERQEARLAGDIFKSQLIKSGILKTIISMFVKFPWNNFWHNVVFDIVQQIFNGKLDQGYNALLILELFDTCDITQLIIYAHQLCHDVENTSRGLRMGYMGHLVLIAEEVVKFSNQFHSIPFQNNNMGQVIYGKLTNDKWIDYVTNVLTKVREQYNRVLGGIETHEEFEQEDYHNKDVIILGNSEEEIRNQPVEGQQEQQGL